MSGFQPDVFGSSPNGCTKFTTKGLCEPFLVVLAQLAELLIVGQEGMGSKPIGHPKQWLSSVVVTRQITSEELWFDSITTALYCTVGRMLRRMIANHF